VQGDAGHPGKQGGGSEERLIGKNGRGLMVSSILAKSWVVRSNPARVWGCSFL
jgi:hypothetical protein